MTANASAQHSNLFKVGFDMAGVHVASDLVGRAHSAVGTLDTWTSPVFLVQGDDDMNVDINTHDLYQTFEQLVEIYTDGSDFLLEHLHVR